MSKQAIKMAFCFHQGNLLASPCGIEDTWIISIALRQSFAPAAIKVVLSKALQVRIGDDNYIVILIHCMLSENENEADKNYALSLQAIQFTTQHDRLQRLGT